MAKMCDICGKRPATTFTSYTINGVTHEQCMCSECAKKYDIAASFAPKNFFASVFGDMPSMMRPRRTAIRQCSVCGATEDDILNNCAFGCSECYKTFGDIAEEMLRRMGATYHIGKTPLGIDCSDVNVSENKAENATDEPVNIEPTDRLTELKKQLRAAVDTEDFELASKLKKEIDKLKAEGDK